ncbi:MAG: hypothetical protein HYZ22_11475 [Chloroflexi bacterium]|nr:hypothetical protein [Chloroflexota bacterium]
MKRIFTFIIISVNLTLVSCGGDMGGTSEPPVESVPLAWIDSPLEGMTFPLGEIEIISHTQDLGGIAHVELSANGQVIRTDENLDSSLTLFVINQPWTPTQPGEYLVQVRGQATGGAWSNYAEVHITVIDTTATPTTVPTATPTSTPIFTLTPVAPPTLTLTKNAFCRKGPDTDFPDVTAIPAGDTVNIEGISEDNQWYFVFWEKFDTRCWVNAETGDVSGDLSSVEALAAPTLSPPTGIPPTVPACTLTCPAGCQPNSTCTACQAISGGACKP